MSSNVPLSFYNFALMTFMMCYSIYMGYSIYQTSVTTEGWRMWGLIGFLCFISTYFSGVTLWRDWKRSKAEAQGIKFL